MDQGACLVTKTILDCADLALMPCQPSGLDLSSSGNFLRIVRHRQKFVEDSLKLVYF